MISSFIIKSLIAEAAIHLSQSTSETAVLDASLLLAHVLGVGREALMLEPGREVAPEKVKEFEELVQRRAKGEPIAYITGKKEFWSLDFTVTRDTLIPRPDSETLVEAALERAKKIAHELKKPLSLTNIGILDIGTGTGCLLIALMKTLPSAHGVGVDISERAVAVARQNGINHKVDGRVQFIKSNWFDAVEGNFDLIVSNPPYIAESERDHLMNDVVSYEPHTALFSGADGMDSYRAIAQGLSAKLNRGGYAVLEVGSGQAQAVSAILEKNGMVTDEIRKDLSGIPRCVIAYKQQ